MDTEGLNEKVEKIYRYYYPSVYKMVYNKDVRPNDQEEFIQLTKEQVEAFLLLEQVYFEFKYTT